MTLLAGAMQAYEFMDTLIMILRKKNAQLSFLHVYHHASTFAPCWWAAVNFAPGGGKPDKQEAAVNFCTCLIYSSTCTPPRLHAAALALSCLV